MGAYILRRLLLIVPTLFGIMVINFIIVQFAPGGPVEPATADNVPPVFRPAAAAAAQRSAKDPSALEATLGSLPATEGRCGRFALRSDVGAALERQLLLESPEDVFESGRRRRPPRRLLRWLAAALVLGGVACAVLFYLRERGAWQRKAESLERRIGSVLQEASEREEALRRESRAKDQEILERRRDAERVAKLAEDALQQLRTTLEDFRRLSDEKRELEREYRKLLADTKAPLAHLFGELLPKWAARLSRSAPQAAPTQPASGEAPESSTPNSAGEEPRD